MFSRVGWMIWLLMSKMSIFSAFSYFTCLYRGFLKVCYYCLTKFMKPLFTNVSVQKIYWDSASELKYKMIFREKLQEPRNSRILFVYLHKYLPFWIFITTENKTTQNIPFVKIKLIILLLEHSKVLLRHITFQCTFVK